MPNLVYPSPYPMVSGAATDGADVLSLIDNGAAPEDSWSIINGMLDYLNVDASYLIPAELTQRGSMVDGGSVSGTANLDYCWRWFGDYDSPADQDFLFDEDDPYQYIPGACASFDMPWDGYVLLSWTIFAQNDNYSSAPFSGLFVPGDLDLSEFVLLIDGDYENGQHRSLAKAGTGANPQAYVKARAWSGMAVVPLTKGHHDVGIALVADQQIRMTRVHACSMKYMMMKGAT